MNSIYLDHCSTTPLDPAVIQTMHDCMQQGYANPASQHRAGQTAKRILEQKRLEIMTMLDARTTGMATDSLIFTSGGTESNNLSLIGLAKFSRKKLESSGLSGPFRVLISTIEHPSIVEAANHLAQAGFEIVKIPVDQQGIVHLNVLEKLIQDSTTENRPVLLASIMLVNNETGTLQPIQELASICREHQILFHTDAVQAVGKLPVSFQELGVDALSLTAHKLGGPRGIGGLLIRQGILLEPILFGGFQQMGLRPGTEDLVLVAGMQQAIKLYLDQPDRMTRVKKLRDQLETELTQRLDGVTVVSQLVPRAPHILNIAFCGIDRQAILLATDMAGLAISTGSACASGSSEPSAVLSAMGLPGGVVESSIRISLGFSNTQPEIVESIRRIIKIINNLRRKN